MIAETKAEALKEKMIVSAFTAWQLRDTKKTFNDYLRQLGLSDKPAKMTKEVRKKLADRNVALAERIRKASKRQREAKC